MEDLIVVKQLPVIEQKLKQISEKMDKQVEEAKALVCTEESKQIVKNKRTELRKLFEELEKERKTAKEQIMQPYTELEGIYKQYITNKFNEADNEYKKKIESIELEQKKKLEDEARRYFEEYLASKNIDFVTFEKMGLKIGLSDNPTKLKKQITAFIDKIAEELKLIDTQEHKAEILVEYKQTLNVSSAITIVTNRFKAIEEEKKKEEQKVVHIEMNKNHEIAKKSYEEIENIMNKPLEQPKEETKEYILTLEFKVRATRPKLKELKQFLENGGYDYE